MKTRQFNKHPGATTRLQVLYEDNHLLVVAKPAGLLVQGDSTGDVTLLELSKAYIKEKYKKPGNVFLGLVHRLDRPTAGVVVFARTSKAAARLSEQFRSRKVLKTYLALVEGTVKDDCGALTHCLWNNREKKRTEVCRPGTAGGREARMEYRVLRRAGGMTLVEIIPLSGRKHQIRAQFAAVGHPVAGDTKYGATKRPLDQNIALAAVKIEFAHPTTGEKLLIEGPEPEWARKASFP